MVQSTTGVIHRQAKMMAEQMLTEVWRDAGFPVDPVTIARAMGLHVVETDLPEAIAGALLKEAGKDPTIVIHYQDSVQRKRFTCAHELGHYSRHVAQSSTGGEYNYVSLRQRPSQAEGADQDLEDLFADEFAAHLLMPVQEVVRLQRRGDSLISAMVHFGVS
ncbi:MAG: ImmA/IrrE family metallo-endopeptidase, partial [Cyanobacteria bacterium P01_A01_bin.135]